MNNDKERNRQTFNEKRAWYMEDSNTRFHEFYCWLSDWIGLPDNLIPFTAEQVKASKDEHLNDLPLRSWDNMHGSVSQYAYTKGLYWSLCETVCCLKTMARRRRDISS